MANRKVGKIYFKVDGVQYAAKGAFSYNLGRDRNEASKGADGHLITKVTPQPAFCEGAITDGSGFDLAAFLALEDATVTLELQNGKTIVFNNAINTSEGTVGTEEGEMAIRFDAESGEEMK